MQFIITVLVVLFSASFVSITVLDSFSETLPKPNMQIKNGIEPLDVICKNNYQLMLKTSNSVPICVKSDSAQKLSSVGFAILVPANENRSSSLEITKNIFQNYSALDKIESVDDIQQFLKLSQNTIHLNDIVTGTINPNIELFDDLMIKPRFEESQIFEREPASPSISLDNEMKMEGINSQSTPDFSTTNIQVKNVDEPDFVKNDGSHIYVLNGDKLATINAYPPEYAELISKIGIDLDLNQDLDTMLLNDDKLVLFSQNYQYLPVTDVLILDIQDKKNPEILKDFSITGFFVEARMINGFVYLLTSSNLDPYNIIMPEIIDSSGLIIEPNIFYFPQNIHYRYVFNTITAFDVFGDNIDSESFVMGDTNSVYVSEKNMYITYTSIYPDFILYPFGDDIFFTSILNNLTPTEQVEILLLNSAYEDNMTNTKQIQNKLFNIFIDSFERLDYDQQEKLITQLFDGQKISSYYKLHDPKTLIHKISLDGLSFTHEATGRVIGYPINQFAMDEFDGKFRIATTIRGNQLTNTVYNLDENLEIIGKLENIAPGENIYSARFMGDKLYLVTFKQIDPFFVIDLSSDQPKILGELKIPGFSDYLHPYDKNKVIGIGRDTTENQWGGVQQLGIKISMFDVSDIHNPKQLDYVVIGDSGTYSVSLNDHKAVLVDKNKSFLSIPITHRNTLSFFVYDITDRGMFVPKGEIEHGKDITYNNKARSLYIGNFLYTITPALIKINELNNIDSEINKIVLNDKHRITQYVK